MWTKTLCLWLVPAALCGTWLVAAQESDVADFPAAPPEPMEHFKLEELRERAMSEKRTYLSFLDRSTLSTGLYRLPAGATDGQSPHELDEVYYVLSGKAQFEVEGESEAIGPGAVLFVAAHAAHRFHEIEEDLELLVFFSKAESEPRER